MEVYIVARTDRGYDNLCAIQQEYDKFKSLNQ